MAATAVGIEGYVAGFGMTVSCNLVDR